MRPPAQETLLEKIKIVVPKNGLDSRGWDRLFLFSRINQRAAFLVQLCIPDLGDANHWWDVHCYRSCAWYFSYILRP